MNLWERHKNLPFYEARIGLLVILLISTYISWGLITGVLWGIYLTFIAFLYICVSEPIKRSAKVDQKEYLKRMQKEMSKRKEEYKRRDSVDAEKLYKGWMNFQDWNYDPFKFNIKSVETVLVRLEGKLLRISKPEQVMLKHGHYDDPALADKDPKFVAQKTYNLTNATVHLSPRDLSRRRWFSRKYPICIKLASENDNVGLGISRQRTTASSLPILHGGLSDNSGNADYSPKLGRKEMSSSTFESYGGSEEDNLSLPNSEDHIVLSGSDEINTRLKHQSAKQPFRNSDTIYLFARCGREKERWFHLLRRTCARLAISRKTRSASTSSDPTQSSLPVNVDHEVEFPESINLKYIYYKSDFEKHLEKILQTDASTRDEPDDIVFMDLGRMLWTEPNEEADPSFNQLANLLISRILYDFFRDRVCCDTLKEKVQKKVDSLHAQWPQFIKSLTFSNFDIGTAIPSIEKIYKPVVNEWGMWIDFSFKYEGMIKLSFKTVLDLKHDSGNANSSNPAQPGNSHSDGEVHESSEMSPVENHESNVEQVGNKKKKGGKKMLQMIDKLKKSNFFKYASELRPIRKLIDNVSATDLTLNVEITMIQGTMTLNLASPPSDRLWYSFRHPPEITIRAVPHIGERTVLFTMLSDWIEKKLLQLLDKNVVMPNMDDVPLPFKNLDLLKDLSK